MQNRLKILFLSTRNDCRSLMCEAMTRQLTGEFLEIASAGIAPVRELDKNVVKYLTEAAIRPTGLRPRSTLLLEDYQPDLIISVCTDATLDKIEEDTAGAGFVQWHLNSPAAVKDNEDAIANAYRESITQIGEKLKALYMAQRQGLLDSPENIQRWCQAQ